MSLKLNVSRLKTIIKWVLITDIVAVIIGVITLPWRSEIVAATAAAGIPQPSPIETIGLFVCTIVLFYAFFELYEAEMAA